MIIISFLEFDLVLGFLTTLEKQSAFSTELSTDLRILYVVHMPWTS